MAKLNLSVSSGFVSGACHYEDHPLNEPLNRRLVIPLRLAQEDIISNAVVDTGAPWSVFNPSRAREFSRYSIEDTDHIRGTRFVGDLWRIPVELIAEYGNSVRFEATVFIPKLRFAAEQWSLPDFVGLQGFLDRIRFAVDPEESLFYSGALGEA